MNEFVLDSREVELTRPRHKAKTRLQEIDGQAIATAVVDARKNPETDPTVIWPQSYRARLETFELRRLETMAAAADARFIAVDMPGVGLRASPATFRQNLAAMRGNLDHHAATMLAAINQAVEFKQNEAVEFFGYSLGAWATTSLVKALGRELYGMKLKVPRVRLLEVINDAKTPLLGKRGLLRNIQDEDEHTDRYLNQNQSYGWLSEPLERRVGKSVQAILDQQQRAALNTVGLGFRRSFLPTLLRAIDEDKVYNTTGISSAQFHIMRFEGSLVARESANHDSVEELNGRLKTELAGAALWNVQAPASSQPHRHPAIHSMPNAHLLSARQL